MRNSAELISADLLAAPQIGRTPRRRFLILSAQTLVQSRLPPPAFIGDVDHAPVVILMANGGFDAENTPAEFPEPADRDEYVAWLHGPSNEMPRNR